MKLDFYFIYNFHLAFSAAISAKFAINRTGEDHFLSHRRNRSFADCVLILYSPLLGRTLSTRNSLGSSLLEHLFGIRLCFSRKFTHTKLFIHFRKTLRGDNDTGQSRTKLKQALTVIQKTKQTSTQIRQTENHVLQWCVK